jgi:protein-tyrosine phosphatase
MSEKKLRTILFVCTGNTCRSSMAEVLAKDYLRQKGKGEQFRVLSAGTGAIDNEPASSQARTVILEMGLDLSQHKSKVLTVGLVQEADIILTMTKGQKNYIEAMVPDAKEKVYLLKEYAKGNEYANSLKEKMESIYQEIEKKQQVFFSEHGAEIQKLEKEKEEMLLELGKTEERLNAWEQKLAGVCSQEIQELMKIEEESKNMEILDPFGQPVEIYRACAGELSEHIIKAINRIIIDLPQL